MKKRPLLTASELEACLAGLPGWAVNEEGLLSKKYTCASFPEAIAFVNRVAEAAERMNHHPFIAIDYRRVTLRLTTWNAGGITALDAESASAYDAVHRPASGEQGAPLQG